MGQRENHIFENGSKRQSYLWEWMKKTIISLYIGQRDNYNIFGNGSKRKSYLWGMDAIKLVFRSDYSIQPLSEKYRVAAKHFHSNAHRLV